MSTRPYLATFSLGLLAALCAAGAAFYYPWPEAQVLSGKVGQMLFEPFNTSQVRSIEVTRFNSDRQGLERIVLQRKGEKWVVPNAAEFNANNAAQVARAINSVLDRKVLDKISDDQQDHLKNGVVDPDEFQKAELRGGLGQKITLKDRNGQALANLIVGQPLQNSEQQALYCVRVPGEPQVYSVQFDPGALSTRFQDWVDPNLLRLRTQQMPDGQLPSRVSVNAYRVDSTKLGENAPRGDLYRSEVGQVGDRFGIQSLKIPASGEWKAVAPNDLQQSALADLALRQLGTFTIPEVRLKPKPLADFFRKPERVEDPALFQPLIEFGFRQIAAAGEPPQFEGTGGELSVLMNSGVQTTAYFGNIIGSAQTGTKLNRFCLLIARLDAELLKEPAPPQNADGAALSEDQQRTHQRELDAFNAKRKSAEDLVNDLNQQYAPWIYVLAEDVYLRLLPELGGANPAAVPPGTPPSQ